MDESKIGIGYEKYPIFIFIYYGIFDGIINNYGVFATKIIARIYLKAYIVFWKNRRCFVENTVI